MKGELRREKEKRRDERRVEYKRQLRFIQYTVELKGKGLYSSPKGLNMDVPRTPSLLRPSQSSSYTHRPIRPPLPLIALSALPLHLPPSTSPPNTYTPLRIHPLYPPMSHVPVNIIDTATRQDNDIQTQSRAEKGM
jgi:hypothetical protein